MGCDIHLHIEVKVAGRWEHYGAPSIGRDYGLFTKLAGVRNREGVTPISEPRGLPSDLSIITRLERENYYSYGHSDSWINAEEIAALEDWQDSRGLSWPASDLDYGTLGCYLMGNSFGGFHKYPDERPLFIEDLRFVFWFDN